MAGLDLKVGQKYTVKVELVAKKVGGMNTSFIHLKTCSIWPDEILKILVGCLDEHIIYTCSSASHGRMKPFDFQDNENT